MTKFEGALIIDDHLKPDVVVNKLELRKAHDRFLGTIQSRLGVARVPMVVILPNIISDD